MIQTPASGTCFLAGYFSHQNVYGHSFPSALSFSILPLFPPFLSRNKAARGPTGFLDGAATPPLRGGEHPSLQFIHTFIERRYSCSI